MLRLVLISSAFKNSFTKFKSTSYLRTRRLHKHAKTMILLLCLSSYARNRHHGASIFTWSHGGDTSFLTSADDIINLNTKYYDEPLTTGGTSIYRTTHSDLCGVKFFFRIWLLLWVLCTDSERSMNHVETSLPASCVHPLCDRQNASHFLCLIN